MKRLIHFILLFAMMAFPIRAEDIVLNGTFQGDNLYVKNPFAPSGVGFCVYEVTVNGLTSTDEINSSAFEVDLSVYGFVPGEPLTVTIKYKEGCQPIVLNPEVLNARATFEIDELKISGDKIEWATTKEAGSLPFVVEQFRWNKWIEVGRVNGSGTASRNTYETKVRFNSGQNKFRIKQTDFRGKPKYSKEITYMSTKPEVNFSPKKVDDTLEFTAPTLYEIYDEYGGIIFKGYGQTVNVSGLKKGDYYLNLDNKLAEFSKK
ncbi:hypothetical protein SAMN06265379_103459 [Saccharicrinis carchari]|uniref:Por secretion system C-terminal sorting domain-containing protein n=1 Tax=Saccharicrinis carchari TaxID=1168039 RepID=A0A521CTC3_SACCC|nr:hypothetical protein [Saccharicrinis carchari]SMO62655.1 hypothetical protein SAMN06265379_103459 [Saccharicrinis carchari]